MVNRNSRITIIVAVMLLVLMLMSSCGNVEENVAPNDALSNKTGRADGEETTQSRYFETILGDQSEIACQLTGKANGFYNVPFDKAMIDNPIDKSYYYGLNDSDNCPTTTLDFIEFEEEYVNLWLAELDYSSRMLMSYLGADEIEKFEATQAAWYDTEKSLSDFEKDLINDPDHDIHTGTLYTWYALSDWRNTIRERTLLIKYLTYIIETQNSEPMAEEDLLSTTFQFSMT